MRKKALSILLTLTLCLSLLPATALAESDPTNYVFNISEGSVTIVDGAAEGKIAANMAASRRQRRTLPRLRSSSSPAQPAATPLLSPHRNR